MLSLSSVVHRPNSLLPSPQLTRTPLGRESPSPSLAVRNGGSGRCFSCSKAAILLLGTLYADTPPDDSKERLSHWW